MDAEVVIRAQQGDRRAFARIADEVLDRFLAVAHRILRDGALAEDATQAALLDIWRDLPRLRDPERFGAWSMRILVNACYSEGRRARRWLPNLPLDAAPEPMAPDDIGPLLDREELERGFRSVPMDQRTVIVLHHYLGMPLATVAQTLGVPEGTVRSRLHRGMSIIRRALASSQERRLSTVGQEVSR